MLLADGLCIFALLFLIIGGLTVAVVLWNITTSVIFLTVLTIINLFLMFNKPNINAARVISFENKIEKYEKFLSVQNDERAINTISDSIEENKEIIEFYKDKFTSKDWKAYTQLKNYN